jgi:hypothetical protein
VKTKDEGGRVKDEVTRRRRSFRLLVLLVSSFILHLSSFAVAGLTQEEVLKSINQNVGKGVDPNKFLAVALSIVGVIVVIALLAYRRKRVVVPKVLNHQGKLVKEVARAVNLKPAELKRLKVIADAQDLSSPLVLLLCPSLLRPQKREDMKT